MNEIQLRTEVLMEMFEQMDVENENLKNESIFN
jgi:hypothetical protein